LSKPRTPAATAVTEQPAPDIDFEGEGLLAGTSDRASIVARTRLVEHLLEQGVSLDEIKQAVREGRLVLLPIEIEMGGELKHNAREVAKQSGLDLRLFLELRQSLGLAEPPLDQPLFSDYDLAVAIAIKNFIGMGVSLESVREINRVLGASMSQLAATLERVFIMEFLKPDEDEYETAMRFSRVARSMTPEFGFVLQHILNLHLREQTRMDVLGGSENVELLSDARQMTVCFADLVGFTALGAQLPPDELSEIASRLMEITLALVEPPVRLIKTIGDAVMLASTEAEPVLQTALSLLEAVEAEGEGFPQLRVGIASGEVIVRSGDIYGPPVNLASRLCDVAKPSSILTTVRVHEDFASAPGLKWSAAGKRKFKNIAEPVEGWRLRRETPGERRRAKRAPTTAGAKKPATASRTRRATDKVPARSAAARKAVARAAAKPAKKKA
jgi:adenylate cyclase